MAHVLRMTAAEVTTFLAAVFPQAGDFASLEQLAPGRAVCRGRPSPSDLRPGGTVSGPTLMALADTAAYYLVLATIGPLELAVTSHLSIHFLRKPRLAELVATAELLKVGRRQVVCTVSICSEQDPAPVAHATVTYAIPEPSP